MSATLELEQRYELALGSKRAMALVSGNGATVIDDRGREYIDCVAGHGVALIGHCNPEVVAAIQRQANRLITCSAAFANDVRAELLEELVRITPSSLERAFLCNSGTEAVEAALKFARAATGRPDFVCARRGFHGRTLGALSATFEPRHRRRLEPLVPGFEHVAFNDPEALERAITERTAAVLLEPVQGEGGVHVARAEYLRRARELCDATGAVLILDEVQTGFCRTGRLFACSHFGVEPDLLCLAKGMAGGLPMGAVACSERFELPAGIHGSTYGGNPLACAAALATIRFMISNRLDRRAAEAGERLMGGLRELSLDVVRELRGLGLMIGIALKKKVRPYLERLTELGVLALPAGVSVLRLLPPLTITDDEIDRVVEAIGEALSR
jgi:acetylornithine/LysW-gamma-L-lysine aminotransferase